ncbi:hypothetical protein C8R43DRAFT_951412 [Mycena crocata]|nr:hypothetical protein C8R43DRAFT_951412 [Mycena crocata]
MVRGLSGAHKVSYGKAQSVTVPRTTSNPPSTWSPLTNREPKFRRKKMQYKQQLEAGCTFGPGLYDINMPEEPQYFPADGWQDIDSDDEDAFQALPAGEEGYHHSHAGKEAVFHEIYDECKPGRGDPRRRAKRIQVMVDSWKEQMPILVDTYLQFKMDGPVNSDEIAGAWAIKTIGFEGRSQT